VRDLSLRWDELAVAERRQIVEAITEKIIVGREDVEINLLQVLPPAELAAKWQRNDMVALPFCHRAFPLF
jgi:hypothetical protein